MYSKDNSQITSEAQGQIREGLSESSVDQTLQLSQLECQHGASDV